MIRGTSLLTRPVGSRPRDTSGNDRYNGYSIQESCATGPFQAEVHTESMPKVNRLSLRKFKYNGQNHLFIYCSIRRCAAEPCGVCGGDSRRLNDAASTDSSAKTTIRVDMRPSTVKNKDDGGPELAVLPNPPPPPPPPSQPWLVTSSKRRWQECRCTGLGDADASTSRTR